MDARTAPRHLSRLALRAFATLVVAGLAWTALALGSPAHAASVPAEAQEVRTISDGPPMLQGSDGPKIAACAAAAAVGLLLCGAAFVPERRERVRVRDDQRRSRR